MKFTSALVLFLLAAQARATTYYLSPTGNDDMNDGLSTATPWASPGHPVSCGDVILAAPGTYDSSNFQSDNWGTVACPGEDNVAWLKCETFLGCSINGGAGPAMAIAGSYWGVQGWRLQNATTPITNNADCLDVTAVYGSGVTANHVIVANNVVGPCSSNGINSDNFGTGTGEYGVDYQVIIGNWVYGAAAGNVECYAAISIYEPVESDSNPGTHIYIAGNLVNDTVNPVCQGSNAYGGNGVLLDTFDGSGEGLANGYAAQALIDNNLMLYNGNAGFESYYNTVNPPNATVYVRHNTAYGNGGGPYLYSEDNCGQFILYNDSNNTTVEENIADANLPTGCGGEPMYDYYAVNSFNSTFIDTIGYSDGGNYAGSSGNTDVTYGAGYQSGVDPQFAGPVDPGAPDCTAASSVPECFASTVAAFTPTNAAAIAYGYQMPSSTPNYDPLFPQWLCNVTLPPGLVTMGCDGGGTVVPDAGMDAGSDAGTIDAGAADAGTARPDAGSPGIDAGSAMHADAGLAGDGGSGSAEQGGCGCRAVGAADQSLVLFGLAAFGAVRRRHRRSR